MCQTRHGYYLSTCMSRGIVFTVYGWVSTHYRNWKCHFISQQNVILFKNFGYETYLNFVIDNTFYRLYLVWCVKVCNLTFFICLLLVEKRFCFIIQISTIRNGFLFWFFSSLFWRYLFNKYHFRHCIEYFHIDTTHTLWLTEYDVNRRLGLFPMRNDWLISLTYDILLFLCRKF